jgi:hypothetical protein
MVLLLTYVQDGAVTNEGTVDGDLLKRLTAEGKIGETVYRIGCNMRPGSRRTLDFNDVKPGFKLRIKRMS